MRSPEMQSGRSEMYASQLMGKKVLAQHGKEIGEIDAVFVDVAGWRVTALRVKLERSVLEDLDLEQPFLFGTQSVKMPVEHVSGIADVVVLKDPVEKISFAHGAGEEGI
jgi:sporulation protein YlmC with PRC-barrel domain